jgi:hypothetical protein
MLWFWIAVVLAISIYTFVALVADSRLYSKPNVTYAERFGVSMRGWSATGGFYLLGDFVGRSGSYQAHGHLIDWGLAPLLYLWPIVLIDLMLLVIASALLSLPTALILSRFRIPWLVVGVAASALGIFHGASLPVRPPI